MNREDFQRQICTITESLAGRVLNSDLAEFLNHEFPSQGEIFKAITNTCHVAIDAGWMCKHEAAGIRYGRVLRPSSELGDFSVDVVHMRDVAGPHHVHPQGEIDMVMPIDASAKFDGHGAGWVVYESGSAHRPTVTDGAALVLYLLPGGSIEFTT
ncbi:MAG: DUF4863 family protein [Myxococcota bacterium]